MMRRITVTVCFIISTFVLGAGGVHAFLDGLFGGTGEGGGSSLSFEDAYLRIYEEIQSTENDEYLKRVYVPGFDELPLDDLRALSLGNIPPGMARETPMSQTEQLLLTNMVRSEMRFERQLLDYEKELRIKSENADAFSNMNSNDGVHDIVRVLSDIGQILFGEKWEPSDPSFATGGGGSEIFSLGSGEEDWQRGSGSKGMDMGFSISVHFSNFSSTFGESDPSIAGSIHNMSEALERMTGKALGGHCTTKKIFEPNCIFSECFDFLSGLFSLEALFTTSPPEPPVEDPEVETEAEDQVEDELSAPVELILRQQDCQAQVAASGLPQQEKARLVRECTIVEDRERDMDAQAIHSTVEIEEETIDNTQIPTAIQKLGGNLSAMMGYIREIQETFQEIAEQSQSL